MAKGKKGTGEPYLRGGIYWLKYYVDGEAIRVSAETSNKTEAVRKLNRLRNQADEGKITPGTATVSQLLDLLLKQQRRMKRADIAHVESRIKNHLAPFFGKLPLSRLNEDRIEDYIDSRIGEDAAAGTINRELAALRTALNIGRRKHLLRHVIEWDKLPELNVREGFLDHDDYRRLLSALIEELKSLLVFGYHYGIRRGELLGYQWEYVDWFAKELRIPQADTKNKELKIIPFYGDVESCLTMEKSRRDAEYPESPWIFSRGGEPIKDFRESWKHGVDEAKLRDSLGWFHDLRRSAARNMVNAGIDEKLAMKIGGWKTDSVFRRYRIVARKDLQRAADKMNTFFKGEDEVLQKEGTVKGTMESRQDQEEMVN